MVLVPLLLVTGILVYSKLYGFKHALEELVYSRTNGQYELTIGRTVVHFRSLSFRFNDVRIIRADSAVHNGVLAVYIPALEIQFGSLSSLFTEEFNIKRLVVEEPQVELESTSKPVKEKQEHVMISQEIMKLYPAIESVLNRFTIEFLTIRRASIQVDQTGNAPIRLNFVDLLIEHWRMRNLSAQSQLKLSIRKQNLVLGNARMDFSGIEYNFLEHHLKFSDFHVSTADSLSESNIDISGKTLLLKNLNYKDFYENLKYSLQRAEIDQPVIRATLKWNKNGGKPEIDKDVVTRMLKYAIGECAVDSAVIRNARILIALHKAEDTVKIYLPDVDFRLHAFSVLRDSSTFQVGDVEVNLNGSQVTLSKTLSIKLDEVLYDHHRDLTLKNVVLFSPGANQAIATLATVKVRYFDLMSLILYRKFKARSILAENGTLNVGSYPSSVSTNDTTYHLQEMFIHTITLKNMALNYTNDQQRIDVKGLSLWATNASYNKAEGFGYLLKSIHATSIAFAEPKRRLHSQLEEVSFNGERLNADVVKVMKDSLTVQITDLSAEKAGEDPHAFRQWKSLSAESLEINGTIPDRGLAASNPIADYGEIERVNLASLQVRLSGMGAMVSLSGENIESGHIGLGRFNMPAQFKGTLNDVDYQSASLHTQAKKLTIDYPSSITASDLRIATGEMDISAENAGALQILKSDNAWGSQRLIIRNVSVTKAQQPLMKSDSLLVLHATWPGTSFPHATSVEIFHSNVTLAGGENLKQDRKDIDATKFMPDVLVIHPSELTIGKQRFNIGMITADKQKETIRCAFATTALTKSNVLLHNIVVQKDRMSIDSLSFLSNRKWYASNKFEESEVSAGFHNLTVKNFSAMGFITTHSAKGVEVEVDRIRLDIRRDKRLTDPPIKVKPSTLDGMIHIPDNIGLAKVTIRDGRIKYRHISEKTGEEGFILLEKLFAVATLDSVSSFISLKATTTLYNTGRIELDYETLDDSRFRMDLKVKELDLTKLNQIVVPLQSLRIRSGYLKEYAMSVNADDNRASGNATISYKGLHLEIFKQNEPDRKNIGSEVITLLADGIILKHSKENAASEVNHERVKHKSVFHYWVTSAVSGAMGAVRKGRKIK